MTRDLDDDWPSRLEAKEERDRQRHFDRVADMVPPECDCPMCCPDDEDPENEEET